MIAQRTLRQWHRVLAWIVGLQVALWMISGLYMTAAPIDWIHMRRALWMCAAIIRTVRRGLPGTVFAHKTGGRFSIR